MASRAAEMLAEKIFVHRFDEHIKAEIAPVQFHEGMCHARSRQTGIAKKARRHVLREIAAVLAGIVEQELAHARVGLVWNKFVETHRETRFLVQRSKAAHALQVDGDVREYFCSLSYGAANVLPVLPLQCLELLAG